MTEIGSKSVAVVTGGASGLGRGTVDRLLRDGFRLAILDIDQGSGPVDSETCLYFEGDVSDRSFVEGVAADVIATWGRVDALVNNAGVFPRGEAISLGDDVWERVLAVNLTGTFLCSQVFARLMFDRGGAIVTTAAGQAFRPRAGTAAYTASKGGIVSLTRALAVEWAPSIRVNCVVPGLADTSMPRIARSEESMRDAAARNPMDRVGQPADTAAAVSFLLSQDAAYITGQTLGVNGGSLMF